MHDTPPLPLNPQNSSNYSEDCTMPSLFSTENIYSQGPSIDRLIRMHMEVYDSYETPPNSFTARSTSSVINIRNLKQGKQNQ